jgi:hypothetical protein
VRQRTPRSARVGKTNQFWQGHQPHLGVPRDPRVHVVEQLLAFMRAVGNGPRAGCTKRAEQRCPCPVCPPLFSRSADRACPSTSRGCPRRRRRPLRSSALSGTWVTTQPSSPASVRGAAAYPRLLRRGSLWRFSGCKVGTLRTWQRGDTSRWAAPSSCITHGTLSRSSPVCTSSAAMGGVVGVCDPNCAWVSEENEKGKTRVIIFLQNASSVWNMITNSDFASNPDHQFGFCVKPEQQNHPITSAMHTAS